MPLLKIETTIAVPEEKKAELLKLLSKAVAEILGKPEQYVMVTLSPAAILMSGAGGPAAFADLRSIGGINNDTNRRFSQRLSQLLQDWLGIAPNRVYLTFLDVPATNWAWNGSTFG